MAITVKSEAPNLTRRQQKGRAVNAVAELLRKRLSVPNIYLEPRLPYIAADVFAVDRAGAGDLHAVEIKLEDELRGKSTVAAALDPKRWMLPAHYKYLAIPRSSWDLVMGELGPLLYSSDGIGRVGIVAITDRGQHPPTAELSIVPERFRVDAAKLRNIETRFLAKVRPDIEVRI